MKLHHFASIIFYYYKNSLQKIFIQVEPINNLLMAMGRKAFIAATVTSFVLISLIAGMQPVNMAKANPTQTPISTQKPTISILYPKNDSFFNVSLGGVVYKLIYETNSTLSWVGYSIDGGFNLEGANNVTVTGNSTTVHVLVNSNGYQTLTVYANDTSGNWAVPQTVTYLVNFYPDYTPAPSPSPTIPEFSGWIIMPLLIVIGLLVYLAKHKIRN